MIHRERERKLEKLVWLTKKNQWKYSWIFNELHSAFAERKSFARLLISSSFKKLLLSTLSLSLAQRKQCKKNNFLLAHKRVSANDFYLLTACKNILFTFYFSLFFILTSRKRWMKFKLFMFCDIIEKNKNPSCYSYFFQFKLCSFQ
jgi:hypothetical protein